MVIVYRSHNNGDKLLFTQKFLSVDIWQSRDVFELLKRRDVCQVRIARANLASQFNIFMQDEGSYTLTTRSLASDDTVDGKRRSTFAIRRYVSDSYSISCRTIKIEITHWWHHFDLQTVAFQWGTHTSRRPRPSYRPFPYVLCLRPSREASSPEYHTRSFGDCLVHEHSNQNHQPWAPQWFQLRDFLVWCRGEWHVCCGDTWAHQPSGRRIGHFVSR